MGAAARAVLLAIVQALGERYASEEAATRSGGP